MLRKHSPVGRMMGWLIREWKVWEVYKGVVEVINSKSYKGAATPGPLTALGKMSALAPAVLDPSGFCCHAAVSGVNCPVRVMGPSVLPTSAFGRY